MAKPLKMTKAHDTALRQLAKKDGADDHYLRAETGTALGNRLRELKEAGHITLASIEQAFVLVRLSTPEASEIAVEYGSEDCKVCEALFNPPFQMSALIRAQGASRVYSLHAPIRHVDIQVREGSKQWGVVQRLRTSPFRCAEIIQRVPEYRTYRINDAGRAVARELA